MNTDRLLAQFRKVEELPKQAAAIAQRGLCPAGIQPEPHQADDLTWLARQGADNGADTGTSIGRNGAERGVG